MLKPALGYVLPVFAVAFVLGALRVTLVAPPIGPLAALAAEFSDLSFGSYPFILNGAYGTNLVVRGRAAARLDQAMVRMVDLFGGVRG